MRFVGDTHADWKAYLAAILGAEESIQVGDFGMGFSAPPLVGAGHRFIRGNHDDPEKCRTHPNWIPDGQVVALPSGRKLMAIGGAFSIDRPRRLEGVSWWSDEELTILELNRIIDDYENVRPDVVVSHDCPALAEAALRLCHGNHDSRTQQALTAMLDIHQPEHWIFGHYHKGASGTALGTRFRCLGINEATDIDV